jgi:predicted Zn-dependent protease
MVTDIPDQRLPGALAFALPYEGVHIQVFYNRVQAATEPELTPTVLAHVLAHEITHILQGTSRHSESGVMKARWNHDDYLQMKLKPLSFTEEDEQLIRFGMAGRANAGRLIAATPTH